MIRAATLRYGGQRRNRLSKISAQAWRWSEVAPFARGESATSRLDDRHHLAFGDDIIDGDENGFQCAGGRRRNRNLHLHGFDAGEGDVIQVVSRAFDVLRCFEGHEARLGNLEISNRCGLPRSTVSRLTHTLTRMGQLVYLPRDQKYRIVSISSISNMPAPPTRSDCMSRPAAVSRSQAPPRVTPMPQHSIRTSPTP